MSQDNTLVKVKPSRRPLLRALLSTFRNKQRSPQSPPAPRVLPINNRKNLHIDVPQQPPANVTANGLVDSPESALLRPRTNRSSSSLSSASHSSNNSEDASADASIRPITPASLRDNGSTTSRSTSISRTNRTYKSGHSITPSHASTKQTTLFSVASDSGANRIALVRNEGLAAHMGPANDTTPTPPFMRLSSNGRRGSSNTTGSALPSSASIHFSTLPATPTSNTYAGNPLQAPTYSLHHPRHNPHPSSPALDNASMLTLASSNAAGDTHSLYKSGVDENASVKALPPLSRRPSDESFVGSHRSAGSAHFWAQHSANPAKKRPDSLLTIATNATNLTGGPNTLDLARGVKRKSANDSLLLAPESQTGLSVPQQDLPDAVPYGARLQPDNASETQSVVTAPDHLE